MPIETLDFAQPFFCVQHITGEDSMSIEGRAIVLNLGRLDLSIEDQAVAPLSSVIVQDSTLNGVERAVIVHGFDAHADDNELFAWVKDTWPSAFDIRQEERLRGVSHYMSPKVFVGNVGLTMYHSGSVPLNVGLHKDHPFCPVPGFREVHTQIVGFGKMQQCRERDVETLYLEEFMAPGTTHKPMYDAEGNYPWHQYETITPSIFMAVEMLPEGVRAPEMEVQNG
ncbi:hypothetical protein [Ruegeria arenilitoris]|uniref:hypothetical protein n=1 Tax=Ruegeria arenilitoris TaxID=1173585 RepID=UPI001CFE679F|nr:hypothetical protein [Ruegeria arenilitoris]